MGNDPCYIQKFIFSKNRQESSDDRSDYRRHDYYLDKDRFFSEFRDKKSVDFYDWKFEVQNSRVFSSQAIVFVYTIVAMNKQCVAQVHWKNAFVR